MIDYVELCVCTCACVCVANWNDWLYQWIGYNNWTYFSTIQLQPEDLVKSIWLKCDGLDTIATIRWSRSDNFHSSINHNSNNNI